MGGKRRDLERERTNISVSGNKGGSHGRFLRQRCRGGGGGGGAEKDYVKKRGSSFHEKSSQGGTWRS